MSLINKEHKEEFETVQVKLPVSVVQLAKEYAGHLESSVNHVTGEALKYVITHDKEFMKTVKLKSGQPLPEKPSKRQKGTAA